MPTASQLSPQELLNFFQALAGDEADGDSCQLHYGCSCLINYGIQAAEKLLAIQALLGDSPHAGGAGEQVASAEIEQRVTAAEDAQRDLANRLDRAVKQNLKLADENIRLEQRARKLQDQINRLMDMREMSSILGRLEKRTAAAEAPSDANPEKPQAEPAPSVEPENLLEFESAVPFRETPGAG